MPIRLIFSFALLAATAACSAQTPAPPPAANYQAGQDYDLIEPPQTPSTPKDKIEVIEVFGYPCIHCAHLDPVVEKWRQNLAPDVAFSYMPAIFGDVWEAFARAYYTAETMGIVNKTHSPLFKAIHEEKRQFHNTEDIAEFYTAYGVKKDEFLAMMNSFTVNAKVARAQQQAPRYGVDSTPTLIVNGKYRVVPREGGFPKLLEIADYLIAKERAAIAAS